MNKIEIVPLGELNKKNKHSEDDEEDDTPKMKQAPPFSNDEDEFVYLCAKEILKNGADKLSNQDLDVIAVKCNKLFHSKFKVRTGPGLWWHIKREKIKAEKGLGGSPYMNVIPIGNGTPKYRKPSGGGDAVRGEITSATKPNAPVLPAPPTTAQKKAQKAKPGAGSGLLIELLVKGPDGQIEKFSTKKFNSIEELMFAVT